MLETSKERVALLKKGVDASTIEKLYIIYNNIKLVQCPVLFDFSASKPPTNLCRASQFEARMIEMSHKKSGMILIASFIFLNLVMIFPVTDLFTLLLSFLFIPPILVAILIIYELGSIISMEVEKILASEKSSRTYYL